MGGASLCGSGEEVELFSLSLPSLKLTLLPGERNSLHHGHSSVQAFNLSHIYNGFTQTNKTFNTTVD